MMRKKLLIALGVIVVLMLLYALVSMDRGSGDLPRLQVWSEGADEIILTRSGDTLRIVNRDGRWLLGDAAYPADKSMVTKMEEKMRDLNIAEMISRLPQYERFDLTPEAAIRVTVKRQGQVLRDVYIGKRSSKTSHTFIRLEDRPEIFKASGTLAHDFDKKLDDLRDRVIFDLKADAIESFEIIYRGKSSILARVKEEVKDVKKKEKDGKKSPALPDRWVIRGTADLPADLGAVQAVISSFNPLKAQSFAAIDLKDLRNPLCTLRLKSGGRDHELVIFRGSDDTAYSCITKDSPYVFELTKHAAERYFRSAADFKQ